MNPPPESNWTLVLGQLKPQMSRATFETWFQDLALLRAENGTWVIGVQSPAAKDWLENRLYTTIQRTVAHVVGREINLQFVLNLPAVSPPATSSACAAFAQEIDFQRLWFEKGRSSGYTRVPDYAFQFWMLYLNQIKPKAFDLWFRIISDDKRDVSSASFTFWTPVKKYSIRALGRAAGTKSTLSVTGGPRPCWFNEQAKKLTGDPLAVCCGKYSPAKWHETGNGTRCCQHWQTGLLEVLFQEGLVAIEIVKPPPGKPRAHELRLQAWLNIPLLTPQQVNQLNEVDQLRHAQWLERYGHWQGIDLARWEQLTDSPSLVPHLPDYALKPESCPGCGNGCPQECTCRCHRSRQLWAVYQPRAEFFAD